MKSKDYPYLDTVIFDEFRSLFLQRYEDCYSKDAIRYFVKDEMISVTYQRFIEEIACTYCEFRERGFLHANIAIFMENRYEYLTCYLAGMFHNISAPMDKELDETTLKACLTQFDIQVVICSNKTEKKVLSAIGDREIICINVDKEYVGIQKRDHNACLKQFFAETEGIDQDAFSVLAFTSGTDGRMKGVMLSQYNIIVNVRGTLENNILGNPSFAFLPMNHTYGMHPCILTCFYNGTTVCLNLNMKYFMRDLKAFNPDFFGAVPLVIETIYDTILREAKKQKKDKKLARAIRISNFLRKFHIDLRHKFFGSLLCDNLTKIVNGGAPISAFYVERFDELGIKLLNGYGLTECAPTIAVGREFNNVVGSSGTIMKHIDVKIADDGEILVSGPNVMLGYYKDDAATAASMENGYFKTGDIGYLNGKVIFVTGRKKNLIVLENGKKVSPEFLEGKLGLLESVKDALVVSRNLKKGGNEIVALLRLTDQYEDQAQSETFKEDLRQRIASINREIPSYMHIDDFEILEEDFQKTSTMKIKRNLYV